MSESDSKKVYKSLVWSLDRGLKQTIFHILTDHIGKENAIGRDDLVKAVNQVQATHERQVRMLIAELRKEGFPIASAAGIDGGYYLPEGMAEFDEFVETEFKSKITDMSITMNAMIDGAKRCLGKAHQKGLF